MPLLSVRTLKLPRLVRTCHYTMKLITVSDIFGVRFVDVIFREICKENKFEINIRPHVTPRNTWFGSKDFSLHFAKSAPPLLLCAACLVRTFFPQHSKRVPL